jgi:membrane protein implicated in regulation of membrane protease activity
MVTLSRKIKVGIALLIVIAIVVLILVVVFSFFMLLLPIAILLFVIGLLWRFLRKVKKTPPPNQSKPQIGKDVIDVEYKVK